MLEQRIESKPELVQKLDICLQEDIKQLFTEVEQIRGESVQKWLIHEDSNRSEVQETLASLSEHLTELQAKSQEYRRYQREFKVKAKKH